MSDQKAGILLENDITNAVDENTNSSVRVVQGGGSSGNLRVDQPDILFIRLVNDRIIVTGAEVKRTKRDRLYIDSEDLEQLKRFCHPFIRPALIVKFTHRQLVAVEIPRVTTNFAEDFADAFPEAFNVSVTKTGNLSIKKPDTSEWPSAGSGLSDHEVIIEEMKL